MSFCSHFCFSSSISYPAEKLPPIPFMTAIDALLSSSNCVNCDASSCNSNSLNVFCLSGRFIDKIVTALNRSVVSRLVGCWTESFVSNQMKVVALLFWQNQ